MFETKELSDKMDVLAPDGSEIRLLCQTEKASMVHCTLPAGKTTRAIYHRSVDEIWFVISGKGKIWREMNQIESEVELKSGICVTIPQGTRFQFNNSNNEPLKFIITTIPPWPGNEEAIFTEDYWK